MSTRTRNWLSLAIAVAVPMVAGGLGSLPTYQAVRTWYPKVRKPSWTPPSWVFGPVWATLYTLMGTASWLVWQEGWDRPKVRSAEALFGAQLLLNALWTPIFFGQRAFGAALAILVVLWGLIVATMVGFYRIRPLAGLLLAPYLLWVSYASTLNTGVWWLNRGPGKSR
ncbi:MAG: TspO/MBR family protein [Chloroflexota bacterium]|jgi:benzodiazapine receptor